MTGQTTLAESATRSGFNAVQASPVSAVTETDTSLLALVMGTVLGLLSAVLLVVLATPLAEMAPSIWPIGVFLAGWVISAWYIARQTTRSAVVLRRAFLLGAAEWLLLIVVGRPLTVAEASSGSAFVPAVDPGVTAALTGTFGTVMLWVCVIGLALMTWWTRPPRAVDAG